MSDKRVVWRSEESGITVMSDGSIWLDAEPENGDLPERQDYNSTARAIARALAESEAKVARLARENHGLRDMAYGCGCWGGYE